MPEKPPSAPPIILGTIPAGAFDTALEVVETPPAVPMPPVPPAEDDALRLPRGGLVALRRSGGLRFTVREVVVYGDGRITSGGTPTTRRGTRCLGEREMAEVWAALAASDLRHLPPTQGRQGRDGYAHEIVARLGGRKYATEVFDGSIPPSLAPLIALLLRLRPTE